MAHEWHTDRRSRDARHVGTCHHAGATGHVITHEDVPIDLDVVARVTLRLMTSSRRAAG
jgi:hypothetical protein